MDIPNYNPLVLILHQHVGFSAWKLNLVSGPVKNRTRQQEVAVISIKEDI
jgi:hypothetical protein